MKFDIVKIESGDFHALDEKGEYIVASTDIDLKKHGVPLMKKEWFGDVATSIELETHSEPVFKPILVDGVGLAYNATETYEQITTDDEGFVIMIKVNL